MERALSWPDLEIVNTLGEGHSGHVSCARLKRDVGAFGAGTMFAVKQFKRWVLDQPGQLERIFRELDTGRFIKHPNLVEIVGIIAAPDGQPALVMLYYDGPTLEEVLREARAAGSPLAVGPSLSDLAGLADALATLHESGVIHRDVKPSNIICTRDRLVLADLGVVKSSKFPEQTTTGGFLGTIRYAAPEYVFGDDYDSRIDVYSLGAVAYELMTGEQHLARHQHWAKLVTGKQTLSHTITDDQLAHLCERSNKRIASFVRFTLEHSLCKAVKDRDLDLKAFANGVEAGIWRKSWVAEAGRIVEGTKIFTDRFKTADTAADFVKTRFSAAEQEWIRELVSRRLWWGWVTRFAFGEDFLARVVEEGICSVAAKGGHAWEHIWFAPSVVEAVIQDVL